MKNFKRIAALAIVFLMAFGMVACGDGAGAEKGVYKLESVQMGETVFKGDQLKSMLGDTSFQIELDGKGKVKANVDKEEEEGEYTVDGDKIKATFKDQKMEMTLKDDILSVKEDENDLIMNLKKE